MPELPDLGWTSIKEEYKGNLLGIEPDNGASAITAYRVEILHYDSITLSVATAHCDGETDS